ncbi:helix-turn-helix transcriptional regulator [Chryseobacterium profundimaris]|uniref:AraC-type DNA-binding protein n=1 Tax=Chryseobacterium profundimaris TaxID=1387275 RepID=A0ABY1PIK7_9FLAO|nr:helix-turn-helix domain-containing protein [Chryseobacterium profundimaris]SMP33590.1 AraC-type DNA-binding protein [Chryseobacterium profundimaris]
MSGKDNKQEMIYWADRLGVSITQYADELKVLQLNEIKIVDLLPEMLLMIRSVVAKKTFRFRRNPIKLIENGISISFLNTINSALTSSASYKKILKHLLPHVRIVPLHIESEVVFQKDINIQQVTIIISLDYLKMFLGKDHHQFAYLFDNEKTLWIEEVMSPELAELVNEIAGANSSKTLSDAYYRLKSLELIFHLFKNLMIREDIPHQNLTKYEIESVYRVRDKIAASLEQPFVKEELIKLSGMNVIKLRKIFTQVFGKGMYPYYQYLRMQEAARLLKEEHLSVSETGYQLGFSNLSYFGRLFEKHFGAKPKKWSQRHTKF